MNKLIIGGKEIELSDESWKKMEEQFKKLALKQIKQ